MANAERKTLPWYKNGLHFECTQCGQCCSGGPGYVWVSDEEIFEMATFLNMEIPLFKRLYLRERDNRFALVEKKSKIMEDTYDCIFLKDARCQIYKARPQQCRTFPWWKENLNTEESWEIAASYCEGINKKGAPLIRYEEIMSHFIL